MVKRMLIDATHTEETRVVVLNGSRLEEFDVETSTKRQLKGNIYLAKIVRVEPSLQAAFVDYGGGRHGFLAFNEIHPDYYQIPVADRQALLAEHRAEMRAGGAAASADFDDGDADDAPAARPRSKGRSSETSGDATSDAGHHAESGSEGSAHADSAEAEPIRGVSNIDEVPHTDEVEMVGGAVPAGDIDEAAEAAAGSEHSENSPTEAEHRETEHAEAEHARAIEAHDQRAEETADISAVDHGEIGDEQAPRSVASSMPSVSIAAPAETHEGEGEEDAVPAAPRRHRSLRHYKIQEVIKRRQIVLVQVVKEERGTKGAALTTYLSLAGRYCVLMPNTARGGGVSRKITSAIDRKRLKTIVNELEIPDGMAVIIRTAGSERTKPEIKRDYEYLLRLWDSVRELTLQSSAPALVYEEANLIKRSIRDLYARDIDEILVEGDEGYRLAKDFMRMLTPSHAKKVQLYKETIPMLHRFQVETQLDAMHSPTVQLKSGGYIVINQTEALVAIDVNSGRATRERHIEETAHKTNLEAADEVARQLRLRDLAGLIVIDFIDMEESRNNHAVERRLKDAMRLDRARIQLGRISAFGLLELSRQRLRPSLMESSFHTCTHCGGTGSVRSVESSAMHVLRAIEDEGIRRHGGEIRVTVHSQVALYLLNQKRSALSDVEHRYGMRVLLAGDDSLIPPIHRIDRLKTETPPDLIARPIHMDTGRAEPPAEIEEVEEVEEVDVAEEVDETADAPRQDDHPRQEARHHEQRPDHGRDRGHDSSGDRRPEGAPSGGDEGEGGVRRRRRRRRRGRRDGIVPASIEASAPVAAREDSETDAAPAPSSGSGPVVVADGEPAARRRRRGKRGGRRRNRNRDGSVNTQTHDGNGEDKVETNHHDPEHDGEASHHESAADQDQMGPQRPVAPPSWDEVAPAREDDRRPDREAAPAQQHPPANAAPTPPTPSAPPPPKPSAPEAKAEPEAQTPAAPPRRGWWNRVL